jgi:hypothetical protein
MKDMSVINSPRSRVFSPLRWLAPVLVAGLCLLAVAPSAGAATAAPAAGKFRITKLIPRHIFLVENGRLKSVAVKWAGTATFPVTLYGVPEKGCSHGGIRCGEVTHTFVHHTKKLTASRFIGCSGDKAPYTRRYKLYLVDSRGHHTERVTWTITCRR